MRAMIYVGCSASGKSTFADEYVKKHPKTIITNRDNLRWHVSGKVGWKDYKPNKTFEETVTRLQRKQIEDAAKEGKDVIVADTNLNPVFRQSMIDYCKGLGYEVEIKDFPITFEEALKRDQYRGVFSVGSQVLAKQWKQWLTYVDYKRYTPNPMKRKAIIVDLDGTLFHMDGLRGPFEWHKVYHDRVDNIVKEIVEFYWRDDAAVILMSGRDGVCRPDTMAALEDNNVPYSVLFMREQGDMRKDRIIKEELFWKYVADNFNVIAAIDDRKCINRLWTDLGIKTIDVGNVYEEF